MDVTRHAMLNMAFFGNPPKHWMESENHKPEEMLGAFGDYTVAITSRLTLIFAKPTLNKSADASKKIKQKILENMDKTATQGGNKDQISNLRTFFREYLKCVSRFHPELGFYEKPILGAFNSIEAGPSFQEAFAKRGDTDYRKWAEFLNLIKGYARLNGQKKVGKEDLMNAMQIFEESLETLVEQFVCAAYNLDMNIDAISLHHKIIDKFSKDGANQALIAKKDVARYVASVGKQKEWNGIKKTKIPGGDMVVQEINSDTWMILPLPEKEVANDE